MEKITVEGFRLIGLELAKKTSNVNGQSSIDCGRLWQQFEEEQVADRIPGRQDDAVYAVYYDYEGDYTQPFSYFIGCKVATETVVPPGLQALVLPLQNYLKIVAKGRIPDCIANAWKNIWQSAAPRSYGYDFEVYGNRSQDWNDAEVEIFLSISS
ncbi:MAG TPA: GyrI-like domain-containing protein [Chitinophagaceae bacterium]|jgi:predicted transcriptional regulator YdeE|nr:GyrI-like domain-containing protein [Chitinophagaceae bacterium]